tara:strand:- start:1543 stop:1890 length:348 start_codon:yes stop_codon:yes gene_type:complete
MSDPEMTTFKDLTSHERVVTDANGRKYITTEPFKPDYNTEAVLVEEMQRMAKRIEDLEKSVECMCGICKLGHQRKPLTDEEVIKLKMEGRDLEFVSMTALHRFARVIEAAHGIKE